MEANNLVLRLLVLFSVVKVCTSTSEDPDCVYTVYVRTSSVVKGGTDSVISLTLYDAEGYGIRINNLQAWGGLMGPGYNYFERGNLDIFSGRGPCLSRPFCKINLTSDGSGPRHGWFCNYVEATVVGVHDRCGQELFSVDQWLSTDAEPHQLTAVRNYCSSGSKHSKVTNNFDLSIVDV